jgi:DNA polymerase-3 subunit beta
MEDSVMKLKTERKSLSSALAIVSRVLTPQSSYQDISKHILASANGNGRLILTATNLDLTISASVEAEIENPGTVAIPGKRMTEWVKLMGKETVSFSLDETNSLSLRCGSRATLKCLGADIFPEIEMRESCGAEMDAGLLKKAIQHVAFAASKNEMRSVLTGVLISLEGKKLSLYAADGYRLSVQHNELSQPNIDRIHVIVPAQALRELERILPDEGQLKLYLSEDKARFSVGDIELISQTIQGKYPDVESVIPVKSQTRIQADTQALKNACRAADVIAREAEHSVVLETSPGGDGQIKVLAKSAEVGSSQTLLPAEIEGEDLRIGFNAVLLGQALAAVETPTVQMSFNSAKNPVLIRPTNEDSGFLHVLMPLNIS